MPTAGVVEGLDVVEHGEPGVGPGAPARAIDELGLDVGGFTMAEATKMLTDAPRRRTRPPLAGSRSPLALDRPGGAALQSDDEGPGLGGASARRVPSCSGAGAGRERGVKVMASGACRQLRHRNANDGGPDGRPVNHRRKTTFLVTGQEGTSVRSELRHRG